MADANEPLPHLQAHLQHLLCATPLSWEVVVEELIYIFLSVFLSTFIEGGGGAHLHNP